MTKTKIGKVKRPKGARLVYIDGNGNVIAKLVSGKKIKIGKVKRPAKRMVFVDAVGNVMSMPFKRR